MEREITELVEELEAFELEGDYLSRLAKLTDEILATGKPEPALDAMLALLERNPEEEIGSPGPLIYAILKCKGCEEKLSLSVRRQPTTLSVWALYKLIEKNPQIDYVDSLKEASLNPLASEQIREDAALLLSWIQNRC